MLACAGLAEYAEFAEALRAHLREGSMRENRDALLSALREARRRQGRVQGVLVVECSVTSCPVGEIRMAVKEAPARKLLQPKLTCPRCGMETWFVQLDT